MAAVDRISVILPCYNGADTLDVQLEALARQAWRPDDELLFIDNGSTDASAAIAESYRTRIPCLRIVQASPPGKPQGGVDHSYRVGFAAAKGDAFLLCESDDEVADDWLVVMADALSRHAFVACAMDYQKLNPPELVWGEGGQQSRDAGGLPTVASPLYLPFAMGCAIGFRREVYETVGGPRDDVGPAWDTEYSWLVQLAGFEIAFEPRTVVHYRVRTAAKARYRQAKSYGRGSATLQRKYGRPKPLRYAAYCAKRLAQTTGALAVGAIAGKRPSAYYMWDIGFVMGQIGGFGELVRAARRPAVPARPAAGAPAAGSGPAGYRQASKL